MLFGKIRFYIKIINLYVNYLLRFYTIRYYSFLVVFIWVYWFKSICDSFYKYKSIMSLLIHYSIQKVYSPKLIIFLFAVGIKAKFELVHDGPAAIARSQERGHHLQLHLSGLFLRPTISLCCLF